MNKAAEAFFQMSRDAYVKSRAMRRPIPDPSRKCIRAYRRRPEEERRFVSDCGLYVAQAKGEGINAEEAFLHAFLDKYKERFPEQAHRLESKNAFIRDSCEDRLALELAWDGLDWMTAELQPNLHWRVVFQLRFDDWEEEAVIHRSRLNASTTHKF